MIKSFYFLFVLLVLNACASSTETLLVGPAPIPCKNPKDSFCFQVKKDSLSAWEDFGGSIEDFDYEPGYTYTLEVVNTGVSKENNAKYTLKKVLKKEKMPTNEKQIAGDFLIETFKGVSVQDKEIKMTFNTETGQVSGKGICNRFMGTYTASNDKIKFSQAATTKMMCSDPELERDFFQTMNQVDHFSLNKDQLMLMMGDETVLTASRKNN